MLLVFKLKFRYKCLILWNFFLKRIKMKWDFFFCFKKFIVKVYRWYLRLSECVVLRIIFLKVIICNLFDVYILKIKRFYIMFLFGVFLWRKEDFMIINMIFFMVMVSWGYVVLVFLVDIYLDGNSFCFLFLTSWV